MLALRRSDDGNCWIEFVDIYLLLCQIVVSKLSVGLSSVVPI